MDDLLITGGTVVDPANALNGRADVAIKNGIITAVAQELSIGKAQQVVCADGKWVLPGLVDSHVHVSSAPEGWI